ncbi:MAG TPA: beta-L-arabinofuranosidase domain-containing protein [bacterium]|nr:beta-L-arabinofuranosidase domain-containing protein [bacterium]
MKSAGIIMLAFLAAGFTAPAAFAEGDMGTYSAAVFHPLDLNKAEISGGFWGARREQLREVTLPEQWEQLVARHYLDNFRVAAGKTEGAQLGPVYMDSDLYKWLEAASYVAGKHPEDRELAARVREAAGLIADAQMADGYVNTYYQVFAPERRFTNLWMNHELYCSGHLIEAACADFEATGDTALLAVATRLADLLVREFGPGRNEGVPGHEEIELALVRLCRVTGKKDYLDLASFFIHQRGRNPGYVKGLLAALRDQSELGKIAAARRAPYLPPDDKAAGSSYGGELINPSYLARTLASFISGKYFQVQAPLLTQSVGEGHAVRAMYFYTGAADLYLETGESGLLTTLARIWDNTILKRTYITGGMGSLPNIEGFGRDYELPHQSYAETCAAVGSIFWSARMLLATGEARYADQLERALYNGFLAGLSLDGKNYFYQNRLASFGQDQRKPWYTTACCPPNIARLIASLERYAYGQGPDTVWVNQYMGGKAEFGLEPGKVEIVVESGLPWDENVSITVKLERPLTFTMKLRVPAWAESARITVNGQETGDPAAGTYLTISREWKAGDLIEMALRMDPVLVASPREVRENRGRVAILRGPLLYCLEGQDNPGLDVHKLVINKSAALSSEYRPDLLGGVVVVKGRTQEGAEFTAIPYYAWSNRGPSQMEVWVRAQ